MESNAIIAISKHNFSIFGRYAYLYWIPIFPLTKKGVSECTNCNITLEPKEMNDQLKLAYQNANGNAKTPITYWIGTLIIASLIGFGIYSSNQHDKDVVDYIEFPKTGDVVEYKSDVFYTTFKIIEVTNDSIFVIDNNYEIESQSAINKIDIKSNYTTEPYSISRERFKELFADKTLLDINRD